MVSNKELLASVAALIVGIVLFGSAIWPQRHESPVFWYIAHHNAVKTYGGQGTKNPLDCRNWDIYADTVGYACVTSADDSAALASYNRYLWDSTPARINAR
jgi:hypothetical protein